MTPKQHKIKRGELVIYEDLGIQINCDLAEGQPFVTINTEDLKPAHRYDAQTGHRGDDKPYFVSQGTDDLDDIWCVFGPREKLVAQLGPDLSDREHGFSFAQMLNDKWAEECGMPVLHVMLNDADLYDDQGEGDTASRHESGAEV